MKKFALTFFSIFLFLFTTFFVLAAGNIDSSNNRANLEIDNTDVLFACDGCGVDVFDTEITGNIWGESLGWVNLQPADAGVFNTREGDVSGNAWGPTSGWVSFEDVTINPANGQFSGTAVSQNRGDITFECPGSSCVVTSWRTFGCTDPLAENYDDTAAIEDGTCEYTPEGCTDPEATNFDPIAELDDGSCVFPPSDNPGGGGSGNQPLSGCTDPSAQNYNPTAVVDDNSCVYCEGLECVDIYGCTDPLAENYNPDASLSNGSCVYPGGDGCTNPNAINYNPEATVNDGTCLFEIVPTDPSEIIEGCTDSTAINFNPNANQSTPTCVYDVSQLGCTDPTAINFNPNAVSADGSCLYQNPDGEIVDEDGNEIPSPDSDGDTSDIDTPNLPLDPNNPNSPNNPNEQNPNTLPDGLSDIINNLGDILPQEVGDIVSNIHTFVIDNSGLLRLLGLGLLLASAFQLFPIREINLLLSLFGFYTTKRYWGTVYDSVTKQPLDPAYVTLYDEAGQVMDTAITDMDGRYNFVIGVGRYMLAAQKTDYQFPSTKLSGQTHDELYTHLYFGGPIEIKRNDEVLSLNIPMDPLNFNWNEYIKQKTKATHFYRPWHRVLHFLARTLFMFGFVVSAWVLVASPSLLAFVVFSLYVLAALLRIIGFRKYPRGLVKDGEGFPLSFAIIRLYSAKLNKEVKHTIVASGGHYLMLVPNGHYYMTVDKKLPSGSYQRVHTTRPFHVRRGFVAKNITIKESVQTQEEVFQQTFNPPQIIEPT